MRRARRAVLRFAAGLTIEIGRATLAIRWSAPDGDGFEAGLAAQAGAEAIGDARQAPAVCGTIAAVGGSFYDLRADLPGRRDRYGCDVRRPRDP